MDHGKNVRSPSLEQGTSYEMKTWAKTEDWDIVVFGGFVSDGKLFRSPNKQLKDMLPTDYYKLTGEKAGEFRGKMLDNCLVHGTSEKRITFFSLADGTTAPVVTKAAKVAKTPKNTAKTPDPTPAPATTSDKDAAKREAANARKREARAAKKAADAAKQTAPATESETITESDVGSLSDVIGETEHVTETAAEHVEEDVVTETDGELPPVTSDTVSGEGVAA